MTDQTGQLTGPFAIMLIAPGVGDAVESLGTALRTRSSLSPRVREIATLTIASHYQSEFEWSAHEPAAKNAGFTTSQLDQLKRKQIPDGLDEAEKAAVESVILLLNAHSLDNPSYQKAVALLGEQGLAELVWLCGYYSMLAVALNAFPAQNSTRFQNGGVSDPAESSREPRVGPSRSAPVQR
ncbi:carboxymuconolactone decarboxylase family protein [Arthrobacter bambusae]|uniref:carboxymuconolactone decarboxylase family protein n=1 Tax=Arthrobacter bambusae TaxID=1338426 RepID=UPI002787E794|nr:carboxymuconolactone decarboxylase family protein [Arthrobacter bambusae]MDQ0239539.1 alkylhydroperoxidase family enzyme [Arthrobacter bambusae]